MIHRNIKNMLISNMRAKGKAVVILTSLFLVQLNMIAYADTKKAGDAATNKDDKTDSVGKIQSSSLGQGLINLCNDITTFLLVLSPLVGGLCALYFWIRKSGADDQDQKQWNRRLINTGICTVGAVLVTGMITLITGYFKG